LRVVPDLRPPALPRQHGAWFMLAAPLILGLAAARGASLGAWLVVPGLALLFLARYAALPAVQRVVSGKELPARFVSRRALWTSIYVGASVACLAGILALAGPGAPLLALVVATGALGMLHTALAAFGLDRAIPAELVGMAGLASSAPLVVVASGAPLDREALGLGLLAFAYSTSALAFVRAWRALASEPLAARWRCLAAHAAIFAGVAAAWRYDFLSTGLALSLTPVALRTVAGLARPPASLRRLGWGEIAVGTAFLGLALAAGLSGR
jgi:hypothetical protein